MAIDVNSEKLIYGARQIGAFDRVVNAFQDQEGRLHRNLGDAVRPNSQDDKLSKFLEQTFRNLQGKFTDPIEQQTFRMVRSEMLASQHSNSEHIRKKITAGIKDIQLELSLKAASKTSQGLQQLLSSQ